LRFGGCRERRDAETRRSAERVCRGAGDAEELELQSGFAEELEMRRNWIHRDLQGQIHRHLNSAHVT